MPAADRPDPRHLSRLLPGLALTAGIALVAYALPRLTGIAALSPLVVAILLGMALGQTGVVGPALRPGITAALHRALRAGIVLLGLQLSVGRIAELGVGAVAVAALTLVVTFVAILGAGRVLGVPRALTELIAAGTAVCGASAVLAANTVSRGSDEDVAYAIATVTVLGTVSMLAYPVLAGPLGLSDGAFGVWTGATIHEVAQVAAAAFQKGEDAGQIGTATKLCRVAMLAPLVLAMTALPGRSRAPGARVPVPWFVLGFVALALLNSAVTLPEALLGGARTATALLLAMGVAAMGLQTDLGRLRVHGLRPLALGLIGWLVVGAVGLALVRAFGI